VFLKHDQSKTVDQFNEQLKRQDYYKKFPPQGIEVVSWYIMMGIGQVVTLRVPASRLREVNRAIKQSDIAPSFIRPTTISRSPRSSAKPNNFAGNFLSSTHLHRRSRLRAAAGQASERTCRQRCSRTPTRVAPPFCGALSGWHEAADHILIAHRRFSERSGH